MTIFFCPFGAYSQGIGGDIMKKGGEQSPDKIKRKSKSSATKEPDFRASFLNSLLEKKKELEEMLEKLIGSQKEYEGVLTAGDYIDELDNAQRSISSNNLYSIIERKSQELKRIEKLIDKIEKNENFGICEECGRPIPIERLMIVPDASLCVPCKRRDEKDHLLKRETTTTLTAREKLLWEEERDDEDQDMKISPLEDISISDIQEMEIDDDTIVEEK